MSSSRVVGAVLEGGGGCPGVKRTQHVALEKHSAWLLDQGLLERLARHTPFITLVPTLVTNPLTLSDRGEDRTSVEPGSCGASKAMHS